MFNHLKNDLIHHWMQNPEASTPATVKFLFDEGLIGDRSQARYRSMQSLIKYIEAEKIEFTARRALKKDWIDELPKDSIPCGSNPFMEQFDANEC